MSSELFAQPQDLPPDDNHRQQSPGVGDIRLALSRVLESDPFIRSQRIKNLLKFLVETALTGDQASLKETLIGIEVFDREPGYDSKQDPVVRVEMRRLRSKLSEYYLNEGKADEISIWLDKGTYVPVFSWRTHEDRNSTTLPPTTVVDPPPSDLQQSLAEIRPALEVVSPRHPLQSKDRRPLYILGSSLLALLIAGSLFYLFRGNPAAAPGSFRMFPLAGNAGLETSPVFSPDGKQVAFSWDGNRRNFDIYVKPVGVGALRRLTDNAAHDIDPSWSPDGKQIAFLRVAPGKAQVVIIPATSGLERVVADWDPQVALWQPEEPANNGSVGPTWSPDGSYLLVTQSDLSSPSLIKLGLDGHKQSITTPPAGAVDTEPKISPSGKFIAFRRVWGAATSDLFVLPSHGGTPVRLTNDSRDIEGMDWLDDHNLVYSSNRAGNYRLWQISRSGGSSRPFSVGGSQPQWPAVSRDGRWLAFVEPSIYGSIWRLKLNGESPQAEPFVSSAGQDYSATYSPNGKKIAFVSDRSGTAQIWICDADGAAATQITEFKGSSLGSPQWSSDNRRIVFDGLIEGLSSIWIIDADGSDLRRLNSSKTREYMPTWSRDGQWVYFTSLDKDGRDHLWKQNPDSGQALELVKESFYDARESLDQKTLYMEKYRGGVWEMPRDGGTPVPIKELEGMVLGRYWTLADDTIYFVRQGERSHTLESFSLTTRATRKLAVIPAQLMTGTRGLSVNRSKDSILFVQKDQRRSSIMLQER
jgi:Tol biopolymer transport system component